MKVEVETKIESAEPASSTVVISEALAKFLGIEGKEMEQSEAIRLVWEYIKHHHLEVCFMFTTFSTLSHAQTCFNLLLRNQYLHKSIFLMEFKLLHGQ